MKKLFFLAAMFAAVTLVGCNKDNAAKDEAKDGEKQEQVNQDLEDQDAEDADFEEEEDIDIYEAATRDFENACYSNDYEALADMDEKYPDLDADGFSEEQLLRMQKAAEVLSKQMEDFELEGEESDLDL